DDEQYRRGSDPHGGRSSSWRQCRLSQIHADGDLEPVLNRIDRFERYFSQQRPRGRRSGGGPRENHPTSVSFTKCSLWFKFSLGRAGSGWSTVALWPELG